MIDALLTDLLKKDAFNSGAATTSAFETLKASMTTTLLLYLIDFSKPFEVETDASGTGIGAVLLHDGHPIAFFSKMIFSKLQHSSAYNRERYALAEAILK